jgi:MFS family permease
VCALLLLIDVSGFLGLAPQTQIFEDIICRNYYAGIDKQSNQSYAAISDDERCKIEPVQSELAIMLGYKETLDQLPGIFFGVAYGLLADSIGRRPVLLCGMLGLALSGLWIKIVCWFPQTIPIKMVYLSSPILIFGGGAQVASSMLYVMLADSYPEEERFV